MFRKAAPAVLLLAYGLMASVAWAQDSNNGRSGNSPLSQFRDFLLGDDQEPTTARDMQRRQREARAGDNSSQDDSTNQPQQQQQRRPQQSQQQQQQSQTELPRERSDFGGDRKTRPYVSPSPSNQSTTARRQAGGDAPASPYQYSGKYADGSNDSSSGNSSNSGNSSQRNQTMGSRLEQSFSPKKGDTADSSNNSNSSSSQQRSTASSRRTSNPNNNDSGSDDSRPNTINNPHVAQRGSGPSVMRPDSNSGRNEDQMPTVARPSRTVQDRLTAAQVAEEAPPVRVPAPSEGAAAPPSSRRTASSSVPNAATGPRSPTQLTPTTVSRENVDNDVPTPSPRVAARVETITPTPSAAPSVARQAPAAPVQQPVAKAPSSRRTAEGPLAGVADSRPAKRAEVPVDNVLFTKHSPLISVETSGPKTISVGKEATYVVSLQNAGDIAAQDVIVSIRVPEWADVVGAQTTSGATQQAAQPGEPYQWRLSRFEAHAEERLSLRIVPRQSRPFDLGVQYTFSPIASQTVVEVQEPKLTLDLVGPKEVAYGQTKVFRLTLSNPGTGDAENIIIKLLPLGERKDTGASHQLGTLAAGESKVIEVELTARETGALSIRAEAVADGGLRAEVSDSVLVRRAGLQLDVEAPKVKYAGTPAGFTVHLSNSGNAMAENVQITATLPAGAKFISSTGGGQPTTDQGAVNWNLGSLSAGADATFEVKCSLNSPGENRLQVVSTASDELSATAGGVTRVEALADLKLEIVDPQGPVAVGEEALYEVHIKNRGTKAAEQIEIVSFFSSGMEPTTAQGAQFEISRGQISFAPVPSLGPGSELVLKVKAAADKPGSHVFRTEVVCRSLESKLASEVTTRFYGDESHVPTEAKAPAGVQRTGAITPLPKSDPQQPRPFPTN